MTAKTVHPDLQPVIDVIENLLGTDSSGARANSTEEAIRKGMEEFGANDPQTYATLLERDPAARARLAEDLRVPETYFLREEEQLRIIAEKVVASLASGRQRRLRVWSAGCASGEEAYSLAITFEAAGLAERVDILATDRSVLGLETAAAGRFRAWSLRALDDSQRRRYFTANPNDTEVSIVDRLRDGITFEQHDLTRDRYRAGFDLIVCRNVLLYLTASRGREVVEGFAQALAPGGWLALGAADPHYGAAKVLEQVRTPAGAVYRRSSSPGRSEEQANPATVPRHASRGWPSSARSVPRPVPVQSVPGKLRDTDTVSDPQNLDGCGAALEQRPLDPALHVLQARLLLEAGQPAAALRSAKRARFLAPELVEAHLVLGSAYLALQDAARAAAAFERASHLLEELPIHPTDATTIRLLEIARSGARRSAERSGR